MKVVLTQTQYTDFDDYFKKTLQEYLIQNDLALFHEYLCYPDYDVLSDYDTSLKVKDIAYIDTKMSHDERHKKILPESLGHVVDIKTETNTCNIEFGSHITPFFKRLYVYADASQKMVIYHTLPIVNNLKELTLALRHEPDILSDIIVQSAGNYRKILNDERSINELLVMWKKVFSEDQMEYTLYDLLLPYKKPLLSLALQINIRNIINTYIHDPVRHSKLIAVFPFANLNNISADIFPEDNTHCYRIMIDRMRLTQFVHLSQPSHYTEMQNNIIQVFNMPDVQKKFKFQHVQNMDYGKGEKCIMHFVLLENCSYNKETLKKLLMQLFKSYELLMSHYQNPKDFLGLAWIENTLLKDDLEKNLPKHHYKKTTTTKI